MRITKLLSAAVLGALVATGAVAQTVKIGLINTYTGPMASNGDQIQKSIDLFMPSVFPPIQADSIGELATKLKLDPAALEETVTAFNNATRPGTFDGFLILSLHEQQGAKPLFCFLTGIEYVRVGLKGSGKNAHNTESSSVRVTYGLDYLGAQRFVGLRLSNLLVAGLRVKASFFPAISRTWQAFDDEVHKHLRSHILGGRATGDGNDISNNAAAAQSRVKFFCGELLALQVLFQQNVVGFGDAFNFCSR